jgi:hypothetical protein
MKLRQVIPLAFVILAVVLTAIPVSAASPPYADPDSPPTLTEIHANHNLLEPDDWFLYGEYDIEYADLPDDTIDDTFIFQLLDTDGVTVIGFALGYPYIDNGYGYGVISFYFSMLDAPEWDPPVGNYTIRLIGNPTKFLTPPVYDFTVSSTAFSASTSQVSNQLQVYDAIIDITHSLELEWPMTLLTDVEGTGTVFNASGEEYFRSAIIGISVLSPQLFYIQKLSVDTSKRVWGTSQSDTYKARLNGTWIATAIDSVANTINIPSILLVGVVVLVFCIFFIWLSVKKFQTAAPGYLASFLVLMCFGMLYMGLILVALVAFVCILIIGNILFLRKA